MRSIIFLSFLLLRLVPLLGQVGIGTTNPNPSSILDIQSTNKGVLVPRISLDDVGNTLLDGINSSIDGLLIYNTNAATVGGQGSGFYFFRGTQWERLALSSELDDDWTDVGIDIKRTSGDVYVGATSATNNNLVISNQIIDWDNSNYFLDPSGNSKVNEIEFDDGSAADPSIRFDDATTGFFSPAADVLAYSINSSEVFRVSNNGSLGIQTNTPIARLDVADTFKLGLHGNVQSGLYSLPWNIGSITFSGSSSTLISMNGTGSIHNIPQKTGVSISFETDLGTDLVVQHIWMETDSVNLRIFNFSSTPRTLTLQANLMFLWQ